VNLHNDFIAAVDSCDLAFTEGRQFWRGEPKVPGKYRIQLTTH